MARLGRRIHKILGYPHIPVGPSCNDGDSVCSPGGRSASRSCASSEREQKFWGH